MGLLDLVKQHHAVGSAADGLGQLTAFLVAHISGRRSDQTGDGVFLHIFGHIDPNHIVFIVKQGFCQSLGKLRFTYACGAQEQEGTDGTVGILNAGTAALNGLRYTADGFILTDDPLVKNVFQIQQLLPLTLYQTGYGDACPALDDLGNFLVGDLVAQKCIVAAVLNPTLLLLQLFLGLGQLAVFQFGGLFQIVALLGGLNLTVQLFNALPQLLYLANGILFVVPLGLLGLEAFPLLCQFLLDLSKAALGELIFLLFQGGFLNFQLDNLPVYLVQLRGHGIHFGTHLGAGLINQVNGLIRQETVGDIPVGEGCGGNDGGVGDFYTVEDLVPLLQTTENGNGILYRGLVYQNRLEPTFQSRILFNILPVFVQSGGADAVQLTPGQHRL